MFPSPVIITIITNTIPASTVLEIPEDYTQCNSNVTCIKGASEYFSMLATFKAYPGQNYYLGSPQITMSSVSVTSRTLFEFS